MFSTGDKPGIGEYQCFHCRTIIQIKVVTESLPPCPKCGCERFIKVAQNKSSFYNPAAAH